MIRRTHLLPDIGIAAPQQLLDLVAQIARHFVRRNIGKSGQGQSHGEHVRVVHVARYQPCTAQEYSLLERIGHQCQDLLILVE